MKGILIPGNEQILFEWYEVDKFTDTKFVKAIGKTKQLPISTAYYMEALKIGYGIECDGEIEKQCEKCGAFNPVHNAVCLYPPYPCGGKLIEQIRLLTKKQSERLSMFTEEEMRSAIQISFDKSREHLDQPIPPTNTIINLINSRRKT